MISGTRVEEKLMELVDQFRFYYREKRYQEAKACYDEAITVVCFLELPEERRHFYFGSRELEIEGAFPEEKTQKVREEVAVKTKVEHDQALGRKMEHLERKVQSLEKQVRFHT